jgi:hypothetical protein
MLFNQQFRRRGEKLVVDDRLVVCHIRRRASRAPCRRRIGRLSRRSRRLSPATNGRRCRRLRASRDRRPRGRGLRRRRHDRPSSAPTTANLGRPAFSRSTRTSCTTTSTSLPGLCLVAVIAAFAWLQSAVVLLPLLVVLGSQALDAVSSNGRVAAPVAVLAVAAALGAAAFVCLPLRGVGAPAPRPAPRDRSHQLALLRLLRPRAASSFRGAPPAARHLLPLQRRRPGDRGRPPPLEEEGRWPRPASEGSCGGAAGSMTTAESFDVNFSRAAAGRAGPRGALRGPSTRWRRCPRDGRAPGSRERPGRAPAAA